MRGLACYGPQAVLFTLGPNHTVQQYDTSPGALVKSVQYNPMLPPPLQSKSSQGHNIPGTAPPMPVNRGTPESDRGAVSLSTIQRTANEMGAIEHARNMREEMASPVSSTSRASRTDTMSSRSSNRPEYSRHIPSISSRAQSGTTFSTISPSMVGRDSLYSGTTSMYPSTASFASSGRRSKGSRLRNEVLRSPDSTYVDLFPRTRVRLANVAYQQTQPVDQEIMTADDLRKRMLDVVFGWPDDIEPLIREELHYHQPGSTSAVLLSKWLGEVDSDMMAAAISAGSVSSSDWMVLALSQMGGSKKIGQAFVQRLLQQGDFHTSATILLGLGDREDAVEVYVSRCFYMEAILLTCLVFPMDWERQAHLVRRWGEFVVENSQQHLAIRCFSCTGVDPPLPWPSTSPMPSNTPSQSQTPSNMSSMLSPPISPPPSAQSAPPTRMTTKNSSLKVITSFEGSNQAPFKFPGLASTDRTPTNGPGVTPIAESAISPGGTPGGFVGRQNPALNSLLNRAVTPGGYHRNRLPSIGESSIDVSLSQITRPSQLPTPDNSGSDLEKEKEIQLKAHAADDKSQKHGAEAAPLLLSSARYDPLTPVGKSPMTAVPQTTVRATVLPDPSEESFTAFKEKSQTRNGSRDRKPDGLHIRMPSQDQVKNTHYISTGGLSSGLSDHNSLYSGGLTTGRSDGRSDSQSMSGQSWASTKSPSVSGRSMDQYISSLKQAGYRQRKQKSSTRKRHESREDRKPRSKGRAQDHSQDRSRDDRRYIRPAKRSPSSPKPMSPETYRDQASGESLDDQLAGSRTPLSEDRYNRSDAKGASNIRSGSRTSDFSHRTDRTVRRRSPEGTNGAPLNADANRSKANSRQPSPSAFLDPNGRGRSKSKTGGSLARSPSSPLPMSPQAKYYQASDEEDDPMRLVEANRQRVRSRHRSRSRRPRERGNSSRRELSSDQHRAPEERQLKVTDNEEPKSAVDSRRSSADQLGRGLGQPSLQRQKSERTQKKELAARELEARRESLLRNPEAPPIILPEEVNNGRPGLPYRAQTDLSNSPVSWSPSIPQQHSQRFPAAAATMDNGGFIDRAASVGPYGLPATPRAMRHPRYDNKAHDIPVVPEIPESLQPLPETYYTGHPMRELPRSLSAPIPEQEAPIPENLPRHPAFHKGLHPSSKRNNFSPLGEIGQHRRRPSSDMQAMAQAPVTASIDETLRAHQARNSNPEEPPLLPELQHLAIPPPPPPPIHPPAPFAHRMDPESSSLSSNSNVGVIEMVLDNDPESEERVIEVPSTIPPPPPAPSARSPPIGSAVLPPDITGGSSNHRRGRSDNFKNGIKGITGRLRSSSRGRNTKSPEQVTAGPAPYESVPSVFF